MNNRTLPNFSQIEFGGCLPRGAGRFSVKGRVQCVRSTCQRGLPVPLLSRPTGLLSGKQPKENSNCKLINCGVRGLQFYLIHLIVVGPHFIVTTLFIFK